ncbi:PRPF40A [Symbiodinium natans]|uniref:PRPF40A protein n=1 Tax=Symbiodinium natans TaxID=878477 RepID=A0A812SY65_9DINO|nr:PRPF40A [Symbiodinium natans]
MYGAGNYCADEPEKIDQYTRPDKGRRGMEELHSLLYPTGGNTHPGQDIFYCFLVRVACGACFQSQGLDRDRLKDAATGTEVYMTDERRELSRILGSSPSISYHTLVMHTSSTKTGGHVERFREIVLFDGNRIYPEYLLAYRRLK